MKKKLVFIGLIAALVGCFAACGEAHDIVLYNWRNADNIRAGGSFDAVESLEALTSVIRTYEREAYPDLSSADLADSVESKLAGTYKKYDEDYFKSKSLVFLSVTNPNTTFSMSLEITSTRLNKDGLFTVNLKNVKENNPFLDAGDFKSFTFVIETSKDALAFSAVIK